MDAAATILQHYESIRPGQEEFYKDLHQHPELSHQEHRTAAAVARSLASDGFRVETGIGATGVAAVLGNGPGPTVLLRADMDALPMQERTGAGYASTAVAADSSGAQVPVMHACGHDVHVACLLAASQLLARHREQWSGTLVALFQPAEEAGDGAQSMVEDGLFGRIPAPDVALAQHVLPGPAGSVFTRTGPVYSGADSVRITVYGRGGHGSMPQNTVDPVVLAAMIILRLQTVISRETPPTEPAVLTVGSVQAGSKSNIISDRAVLELNLRTYTEASRDRILEAVRRIVRAECAASGSPSEPDFEIFDSYPLTVNDDAATARVAAAFRSFFGDRAGTLELQTASEDFSDIPRAGKIPYTYWAIGGTDPAAYQAAALAGRLLEDIPANHSPMFLPALQPTLRTGTEALVAAALAWLGTAS
ncbi:amidohydrolase [Paenarthrobacter sp. DKR-5]|uniref:amidohydrolase n=1 Tax=Paenarthrobacter sp. DKR-5 TaxID=2835535 RepID=UPI001BDC1ECA|nr:amidohydrolase [Paenarthrobacter sp. DKR-5]MBT1002382.1 amidohydrolase [Paenarthrobacter sp. DKR-5]